MLHYGLAATRAPVTLRGRSKLSILGAGNLIIAAAIVIDGISALHAQQRIPDSSVSVDSTGTDQLKTLDQTILELYEQSKYEEALPLAERGLAIREESLGPEHPDVAISLDKLADICRAKRDFARAEPLCERSLAIREKAFGPEHPDVATSLFNLAALHQAKNDFASAQPLHERALAMREKTLGPEHLDVAQSLAYLGGMLTSSDQAQARVFIERALAIREKALGPEHKDVASSLHNLARLLYDMADYAGAEPLYERALAIREKTLGPEHAHVALSLDGLAGLFRAKGDYARAEPLYERALAIREKTLGPQHRMIATSLSNLGGLYWEQGEYTRAEAMHERALAILETSLGPDHPDVAACLSNLANAVSNHVRAISLYERSLSIVEKVFGPEHQRVATPLLNLGILYRKAGDYAHAHPLLERSLAIEEKVRGPEHPRVANALYELGALHVSLGDYARAEPLFQRSLAIQEQVLGTEHVSVNEPLMGLAETCWAKGDSTRALQLLERSLAVLEKAFGPENPTVGYRLSGLARMYVAKGDDARADLMYERSLTILEKALGPESVALDETIGGYANLRWAQGRLPEAVSLMSRSASLEERQVALLLTTGSEEQKAAYMTRLQNASHISVPLHMQGAPSDSQAARLALETTLQRKGRLLDAMCEDLAVLRSNHLAPEDSVLFNLLSSSRTQLSEMVLRGLGSMQPAFYRARIDELQTRADSLEKVLSARSDAFRQQSKPVTLQRVQEAIPAGAALVEIVLYWPTDPRTRIWGEYRYAVYVLRRGELGWADLGEAARIDEAVEAFRTALSDPRRKDVLDLAQKLDEMVMRPVRGLLGEARMVFLSPDWDLNLVPFGALVDETGRFLVERYSFTYVTSGRDLLRLRTERDVGHGALVFADPDFDRAPEDTEVAAATTATSRRSKEMGHVRFGSLPGTRDEAKALGNLLNDAEILIGEHASEAALKKVRRPRILHIATHGFFLPGMPEEAQADREFRGVYAVDSDPPHPKPLLTENPLLRSGLALAGANQAGNSGRDAAGEDGILTALEASGLDLWGTDLVVLSACETGVGEAKTGEGHPGEGVYGLRRAFALTGSASQVMSLWKVDDAATCDLMTAYYRRLLSGEGKSEALRQVQLEMLGSPDRKHPYYWASFIACGDWTPLHPE